VVVADGTLFIRPAEWNEILALIRKVKSLRHHPDDRIRLSIECNTLANHVRIGAKVVLPKRVAQHDDVSMAIRVFFGCEGATDDWRGTEDLKKFRRYNDAWHRFRLVLAGHRHRGAMEDRHRIKGAALALPVEVICRRNGEDFHAREAFLRRDVVDHGDALGIGIRQRSQQHCIDDAEDRTIGADSERQDDDRAQCKPRILAQHAEGILQVLQNIVHSDLLSCAVPRAVSDGQKV